ncbi:SDR family NAD(P)-dependent oxidoreductase [Calorimonas adulescens]|uniref:3-oxoacyl-ACP reductase FabG n=1 Tax=Calorimonas adulescens TaxID=2606906 RepID=A0A5D8Q7V8_9THEO|nr:3-oxoacyl-ACP reductase family protein [Calorimonas adulescens]TZE80264.1 3-oxoacyl-ACP reductase FabG [Calorimonas adulescens]
MSGLFDLTGKTAVVTGASSGLGVQFAKALASQGADVAVVARRYDRLTALCDEIRATGRRALAIKCDVTREEDVKVAVSRVMDEFGRIDILVNNAGVAAGDGVESLSEEDWDKVLDTNLKSIYLFTKHVVPHMKEKHYGRIINTASMWGVVGNAAMPVTAYHASKGGVVNLTRALAGELAQFNITVNAIGPGFFESEMTQDIICSEEFKNYLNSRCPMKRLGQPGELDGIVVYLASDASSYTTGQTICVDGGWTAV